MAEEEESSEGSQSGGKKKSLLADWKGMKGWQKAGVLIAGGGLIIAILVYINGQKNPTATGNDALSGSSIGSPGAEASNYPGYGDVYPSVPVAGSAGAASVAANTSGSASPPAFTNIASGEAGTGLLGSGATVYSSGGSVYAAQPGGSYINLDSLLPSGSQVYTGQQGRVWYELPGSSQQLLLTSGAGGNVNKGIGQTVKTPKSAMKVT